MVRIIMALLSSMLDSIADQTGPSIIVAFEELSFLVQESNTALLVCLTTATVTRPFHVEVHPMEGTATGTYVCMYTHCMTLIAFRHQLMRTLMDILYQLDSKLGAQLGVHIYLYYDDEAVEGGEYFTISLFTPYENVEIPLNIADVTIFPDNDGKILTLYIIGVENRAFTHFLCVTLPAGTTVQFALPVYSVLEGETITVCIVAEEDIESLVYVNIVAYPAR